MKYGLSVKDTHTLYSPLSPDDAAIRLSEHVTYPQRVTFGFYSHLADRYFGQHRFFFAGTMQGHSFDIYKRDNSFIQARFAAATYLKGDFTPAINGSKMSFETSSVVVPNFLFPVLGEIIACALIIVSPYMIIFAIGIPVFALIEYYIKKVTYESTVPVILNKLNDILQTTTTP